MMPFFWSTIKPYAFNTPWRASVGVVCNDVAWEIPTFFKRSTHSIWTSAEFLCFLFLMLLIEFSVSVILLVLLLFLVFLLQVLWSFLSSRLMSWKICTEWRWKERSELRPASASVALTRATPAPDGVWDDTLTLLLTLLRSTQKFTSFSYEFNGVSLSFIWLAFITFVFITCVWSALKCEECSLAPSFLWLRSWCFVFESCNKLITQSYLFILKLN